MWPFLYRKLSSRLAHFGSLSLSLLLMALLSAINGLVTALPRLDFTTMLGFSLLSFGLSWALTATRLSGRKATIGLASLGLFVTSFYLGQLIPPTLNLVRYGMVSPAAQQAFLEAIAHFFSRLLIWGQAILSNSPTFDPLAFELIWGLLSWLGTSWAVWWQRRHYQALLALLPLGSLLVITCAYRQPSLFPLTAFMVSLLLLQVVNTYQQQQLAWQAEKVDFSLELRKDIAFMTIPIIMGLTLFAVVVPGVSLRPITQILRPWLYQASPQINPLANLLGLKPITPTPASTSTGLGILPRNHLIGTGSELTHETVMLVQISEEFTSSLYWRSLTYDTYTGQGWFTGKINTISYDRNEATPLLPARKHYLLSQQVQLLSNAGEYLYVAGYLATASEAYQVSWREAGDIFATTTRARRYVADSYISLATPAELRAAHTAYPTDIQTRYLALPPNIPERVTTLAHSLTVTAPTPYDRALALETYLRTLTYTLTVPPLPPNRDLVDYFLFDLKRGYCDYYATSMVVMARAVGLPARLVVGYAPGTYLPETGYYLVTAAEAHSWVEIYFPDYGWQEFEPTGGARLTSSHPQLTSLPPPNFAPPTAPPSSRAAPSVWVVPSWFVQGGGVVMGFVGGSLLVISLDYAYLRLRSPRQTLYLIFRRLEWLGQKLFHLHPQTATPYEFGLELGQHLPQAQTRLQAITELYLQVNYGFYPMTHQDQQTCLRHWYVLCWYMVCQIGRKR